VASAFAEQLLPAAPVTPNYLKNNKKIRLMRMRRGVPGRQIVVGCCIYALAGRSAALLDSRVFNKITGWRVMKKFLVIVCSLALALGVASCAGKGKAPIGKGKAPVVTKG
jgi:hypothetical protein